MVASKTRKLIRDAEKLLAGISCSDSLSGPETREIIFRSAKGSKIYDLDGREFTDYCLNRGTHILGHANRNVVLSAKKHAERGINLGHLSRAEIDMAAFLVDAFPSMDQVCFVNSETEATLSAICLAQSVTGRRKVLSFEGACHGFHGAAFQEKNGAASDHLVLPYNDVGIFEKTIERCHADIACVIVEPVAAHMGLIFASHEFLSVIRKLTRQYKILLIFDEVMTAFRGFTGGAQNRTDVVPDLTCLGGVVGAGFPVGVCGGKAEFMRRLASEGSLFQPGACSAGQVVMRAGLMGLRLMNEAFYRALNKKADYLVSSMNEFFIERKIDARLINYYSMMRITFSSKMPANYEQARMLRKPALYWALYQHLLSHGIVFPSSPFEPFFISGKHSRKDLDVLIAKLGEFFLKQGCYRK